MGDPLALGHIGGQHGQLGDQLDGTFLRDAGDGEHVLDAVDLGQSVGRLDL